MNYKEWKNLNNHIKNKFDNGEKIEVLNEFPSQNFINQMEDNKLYKLPIICIAVDIVDSKNKTKEFEIKDWSKILSEFAFGISKIMNIYNSKFIKIQGDSVYGIFKAQTKEYIDKSFDCCIELNTFKNHLNKMISKNIFGEEWNETNEFIDFGIGVWFSFDNYVSVIGTNKKRDIVFIGESVNYASTLSKLASRNNNEPILFNELLLTNFSKQYKKNNKAFMDFDYQIFDNKKIFGCSLIFTKYLNWIKNNI